MRRDMDFVRHILQVCEESDNPVNASVFVDNEHPLKLVLHHYRIMAQADLVDAAFNGTWNGGTMRATINELTWQGHEFLDATRSDTLWTKTKQKVGATLGTVSFATLSHLAETLADKALGI
ncbi:DUF2513 domain-containing protein [Bifidobacterium olomucense]|uniref:DUF2513 domain-containing protein n=1 Tax=Bifidobacterium olomucense TaxID=2675324 RepID=A0A7Y0EZB4_9BIFI|nr:DUF2513 domain-containing protein [Bifidobacterium sp. DSM 109959]NMM98126.1 hypothetical protein [Bifidobacterium sp. DSM 109959]